MLKIRKYRNEVLDVVFVNTINAITIVGVINLAISVNDENSAHFSHCTWSCM